MKAPLLTALVLAAGGLTGCSGLEINEAICSKGEEPTWAVTNTSGSTCVRDSEEPSAGFARYPRGRVPVWINPPEEYPHRTDDGADLYNVHPNDPDYPWRDEVLAEHPELACAGELKPLTEIELEAESKQSPRVTVLVNSVGNRCFRVDWPRTLGTVVRSELTAREADNKPPWEVSGVDDTGARQFLRVASTMCVTVTASLQLSDAGGKLTTYQIDQAPVDRACRD